MYSIQPSTLSAPSARWRVSSNLAVPVSSARERAQARQLQRLGRGALQGEHHLEQRRAAQVALRVQLLDQPLEGQVLVGVGAERRLAHPREQLREGGLAPRGRRAAPGC